MKKYLSAMLDPTHIIVHYAEIGLKGKNRAYFERKLKENIKNIKIALRRVRQNTLESIKLVQGRLIITLSEEGKNQPDAIASALKSIFGIAYFCLAEHHPADLSLLRSRVLEITSDISYQTFRITARKSYSNLPVTTQKINEDFGEALIERDHKPVSLKYPELNVHLDFLTAGAYLYLVKHAGPGGLPVGSSGRAIVMLSGGLDSPVAAWYAQHRGIHPIYVHFHSIPYTSEASTEKVRQLARILDKFQRPTKLYLVPFATIQEAILKSAEPRFRVILYRRFMVRIAEVIAEQENCWGIFTGESLGQVASQTMENMYVVQQAVRVPIHRPLIGMDKQEIIKKAQEIETHDTSILAHEDCCTLFIPKHPVTKARLVDIERQESALKTQELVDQAIKNTQLEYTTEK
ncbi:MAG: tRNA 4-thiouridine(8) synthase ThiI [FCB group bacterium]|nr:tRNA 4-thiouridine(8) synthase ThiI [FCB group bacterium]